MLGEKRKCLGGALWVSMVKKGVYVLALLVFLSGAAWAENLYVRPDGGSYGQSNGSDWNNAFNGFNDISWGAGTGKLGENDTLWVAGGTYHETLSVKASGTSNSLRLFIKRARAQDGACTSSPGWQSSFDSQVVSDGHGILINTANNLTIDGQVANGIRLYVPTIGWDGVVWNSTATSNVTLRYLQIEGPGYQIDYQNKGSRGIDLTPSSGVSDNILIEYCDIYNQSSQIFVAGTTNSTIQYNTLHHGDATNPSTHENVVYAVGNTNLTFRYNICHDYAAEGFFINAGDTNTKVYGNIFYDGFFAISAKASYAQNGIFVYNNTIVSCPLGIHCESTTSTGEMKNNLNWNSSSIINYSSGVQVSNNLDATFDPFVNVAGADFHLAVGSSPVDGGVALGMEYSHDRDGTLRGQGGGWDVGAYEYVDGSSQSDQLTPPTGLLILN